MSRSKPTKFKIEDFIRESNMLDGLFHDPSPAEIAAYEAVLSRASLNVGVIEGFVQGLAPQAKLRDACTWGLKALLHDAMKPSSDQYKTHRDFQAMQPFTDCNGRASRVIWLWMMGGSIRSSFLHEWYCSGDLYIVGREDETQ